MKIAMQTWGSDGDIRPIIALAAGLAQRDHRVTLAIGSVDDKDYRDMCSAVGVESLRAPAMAKSDVSTWMELLKGTKNPYRQLRYLHEEALFPSLPEMQAAADQIIEGADLAVSHFFAVPLRIAALKRKVPHASVAFWPGLVPDPARPPEGLPNLGRALNSVLWRLGQAMVNSAAGKGYRAHFEEQGQPYPGGVIDSLYSKHLNLIGSSPRLWPHASDHQQHRFCGSFTMPLAAEPESLPAALEAFLRAGPPPLFLTFGSMGEIDPIASEQLLIDAAHLSGERAIVVRDDKRPMLAPPDEQLLFLGKRNHATVMPGCSAVLHHGGAGTTHTALGAGKPAVIVGFSEEQMSWGEALRRSGVARDVFRYGRVDAKRLGAALSRVARDSELQARAAALGAKVRAEDGVAEACRQLERLAASHPP